MRRRNFLALSGLALSAGCSSGGLGRDEPPANDAETVDTEPPDFELMSFEGPASVAVNEWFDLQLTVRNSGGSGSFASTIEYQEPGTERHTRSTDIEVPGGETVTGTISVALRSAANWEFVLRDYDERLSVAAKPMALPLDTTADLRHWRIVCERVTVDDPFPSDAEGHKLVFAHWSIRNGGYVRRRSPKIARFAAVLESGERIGATTFQSESGQLRPDGIVREPGHSATGWVAFEVPETASVAGVGVNMFGSPGADLLWSP